MSHFNNKYYKIGENPSRLLIFIHGYNGSPEAIDYAVQWLLPQLENTVLVVPQAPEVCEKDSANLQWLSFYQVDPQARFRQPQTSTADIWAIFDALGPSFAKVATEMNLFVDEMQQKFAIDNAHTFVMGFSQGAMLSLYTALSRPMTIGGAIMVAGIIAGRPTLEKSLLSRPRLLVLHGQDDTTVQFKTLPQTLDWLETHGLKYQCHTYPQLAHRLSEKEMRQAAEFIKD